MGGFKEMCYKQECVGRGDKFFLKDQKSFLDRGRI